MCEKCILLKDLRIAINNLDLWFVRNQPKSRSRKIMKEIWEKISQIDNSLARTGGQQDSFANIAEDSQNDSVRNGVILHGNSEPDQSKCVQGTPPLADSPALIVVGLRKAGTYLFEPYELGFYCPVCRSECERSINSVDSSKTLKWSEYNFFLWCPVCNLDVPSIICKYRFSPNISKNKLSKKQLVEWQTLTFLSIIRDKATAEKKSIY